MSKFRKKTSVGLEVEVRKKSKLLRDLKSTKKAVKDVGDQAQKSTKKAKESTDRWRVSTSVLRRTLGALRNQLLVFTFAVATLRKTFSLAEVSKNVARDGNEINSKFNTVFRELSEATSDWSKKFGTDVGRATQDVKKWLAGLQDTFVPLGFARKQAAGLSKDLVALAVDVASFNNKADDDVIRDFTSALVGNHETVRKYGILISENSITQAAMNAGINKTYKELTDLEKVQMRYNIILNSTTDAQGDAIRTADSLANVEKRRAAVTKNMYEALGQRFLPIMTTYNELMIDGVKTIHRMVEIPLSEKLHNEQVEFNALIGILQDVNALEDTKVKARAILQKDYAEYIKNIDLEKVSYNNLAIAAKAANDEFERKIKLAAAEEALQEAERKLIKAQKNLFDAEMKLKQFKQKNKNYTSRGNFDEYLILAGNLTSAKEKVDDLGESFRRLRDYLIGEELDIFGGSDTGNDGPTEIPGIGDPDELEKLLAKYYASVKWLDEDYMIFRIKKIGEMYDLMKKAGIDELKLEIWLKEQHRKLDEEYLEYKKSLAGKLAKATPSKKTKEATEDLIDYSHILKEAIAGIFDVDSNSADGFAAIILNILSLMEKMVIAALAVNLGMKNLFTPWGTGSLLFALAALEAAKAGVKNNIGSAADGAFVPRSPGGSYYNVGEGNSDELIIPTNRFNDFLSGNYKLPGGYGIENIPRSYAGSFKSSARGGDSDLLKILSKIAQNTGLFLQKEMKYEYVDNRPLIGDDAAKAGLSLAVDEGNKIRGTSG